LIDSQNMPFGTTHSKVVTVKENSAKSNVSHFTLRLTARSSGRENITLGPNGRGGPRTKESDVT